MGIITWTDPMMGLEDGWRIWLFYGVLNSLLLTVFVSIVGIPYTRQQIRRYNKTKRVMGFAKNLSKKEDNE
jgi:hypothetical protein